MNGNELRRRLARLAKTRKVEMRYDPEAGPGSHGRLFFAGRWTALKDPKKEIGIGLLNKMLADLGLTRKDLR